MVVVLVILLGIDKDSECRETSSFIHCVFTEGLARAKPCASCCEEGRTEAHCEETNTGDHQ